jgi:hypothetical protein
LGVAHAEPPLSRLPALLQGGVARETLAAIARDV